MGRFASPFDRKPPDSGILPRLPPYLQRALKPGAPPPRRRAWSTIFGRLDQNEPKPKAKQTGVVLAGKRRSARSETASDTADAADSENDASFINPQSDELESLSATSETEKMPPSSEKFDASFDDDCAASTSGSSTCTSSTVPLLPELSLRIPDSSFLSTATSALTSDHEASATSCHGLSCTTSTAHSEGVPQGFDGTEESSVTTRDRSATESAACGVESDLLLKLRAARERSATSEGMKMRAESSRARLQIKCDEQAKKLGAVRRTLELRESELKQARAEIAALEAAQHKLALMESNNRRLTAELVSERQSRTAAEKAQREMSQKLDATSNERAQSDATLSKLKKRVAALERQRARAEQRCADAADAAHRDKEIVARMHAQEMDTLQSLVKALTRENIELKTRLRVSARISTHDSSSHVSEATCCQSVGGDNEKCVVPQQNGRDDCVSHTPNGVNREQDRGPGTRQGVGNVGVHATQLQADRGLATRPNVSGSTDIDTTAAGGSGAANANRKRHLAERQQLFADLDNFQARTDELLRGRDASIEL